MKARVQKILRARDKVFQQMRAASQKAYREAHYMEQAMLLGLRSMQKEPEQHAAAIEVVERELAMIRELDRAYIEEAMIRDRKLYPAGFKAWLSFGRHWTRSRASSARSAPARSPRPSTRSSVPRKRTRRSSSVRRVQEREVLRQSCDELVDRSVNQDAGGLGVGGTAVVNPDQGPEPRVLGDVRREPKRPAGFQGDSHFGR